MNTKLQICVETKSWSSQGPEVVQKWPRKIPEVVQPGRFLGRSQYFQCEYQKLQSSSNKQLYLRPYRIDVWIDMWVSKVLLIWLLCRLTACDTGTGGIFIINLFYYYIVLKNYYVFNCLIFFNRFWFYWAYFSCL